MHNVYHVLLYHPLVCNLFDSNKFEFHILQLFNCGGQATFQEFYICFSYFRNVFAMVAEHLMHFSDISITRVYVIYNSTYNYKFQISLTGRTSAPTIYRSKNIMKVSSLQNTTEYLIHS